MDTNSEVDAPILGSIINDGVNVPFGELYLLDFPEWYDVE